MSKSVAGHRRAGGGCSRGGPAQEEWRRVVYAPSWPPRSSQSMQPTDSSSATASHVVTPSMDLARRGAAKLVEGRHHLDARPAGLFRGRGDDLCWRSDRKRRTAKIGRQTGWKPARLLRCSWRSFTGKNNTPASTRSPGVTSAPPALAAHRKIQYAPRPCDIRTSRAGDGLPAA